MSNKLKEHLLEIANKVTDETSLEDIYQQLSLLDDIEASEDQETKGEIIGHQEVISRSAEWLK